MPNFLSTTTHNIAWFAKRHQANELVLKAPFQRNPVWTDKQKAYLIDTILNEFPVPELYMQEFTDAKGNDIYTVVDGQQRLRACLEFLEDSFTLDPVDSPKWADLKFSQLGETERKLIYNYNFVIRVLPDMPEQDLRSMFTRLNRNVVALNAQELRHATYWGEFITTIEKLANDDRWTLFGVFTPNDVRRMLDIEFVSELAVAILHGLQNKKEELEAWYQTYEKSFPKKDELVTIFTAVIGELVSLFPELEHTRWRKKSDFYSLFVFLAKHYHLMPFSREGRSELHNQLLVFGFEVDKFIFEPQSGNFRQSVVNYALSVEKAASDLANRRDREEALAQVCMSTIDKERQAAESLKGGSSTSNPAPF